MGEASPIPFGNASIPPAEPSDSVCTGAPTVTDNSAGSGSTCAMDRTTSPGSWAAWCAAAFPSTVPEHADSTRTSAPTPMRGHRAATSTRKSPTTPNYPARRMTRGALSPEAPPHHPRWSDRDRLAKLREIARHGVPSAEDTGEVTTAAALAESGSVRYRATTPHGMYLKMPVGHP